jgi:hypothetical protein
LIKYTQRILGIIVILFITIYSYPCMQANFSILLCAKDSVYSKSMQPCYSGENIPHIIASAISTILFFILLSTFSLFAVEMNPYSRKPFAIPENKILLLKIPTKIFLSIFTIIDHKQESVKYLCLIAFAYYIMYLIWRYNMISYFSSVISVFSNILEIMVFYLYGCLLIHAFGDKKEVSQVTVVTGTGTSTSTVQVDEGEAIDNDCFILMLLGAFPVCFVVLSFWGSRKERIVQTKIQDMKNDKDVEQYIYVIIRLIEKRDKVKEFMVLQGVLKFHRIYCKNDKNVCPCDMLYHNSNDDEENSNMINDWNVLVKLMIAEGLKKFPKSSR